MQKLHWISSGILALVLAALGAARSSLGAPLPDLTIYAPAAEPHVVYRTFAANDCTVNEGCVQAGARKLLSFTTQTRNVGTADLVLGNPSTNSLFVFDPCHNHYHYLGFGEYRLRDTQLNLVVHGRKIGFCVEDVLAWDPNAHPARVYDCNFQGIQKGWADVYEMDVPCQWIDVTGLPSGNYILEMEMNPDHSILESDYSNNLVQVPVFIPPNCDPVANDDFSNAEIIPRRPISFTFYNACATKQPGEPNHAGNAGEHSVWYQMTAPSSGTVRVSTAGSDFDTLLAVYTGGSVAALTLIASNDDIDFSNNILQSALAFQAVAGTVYHIVVDGYDAAFGRAVLNIDPPLNDAFANCQLLSGQAGRTNGYTIGATKEPGEPNHNADFGGHSVWYCWTAPASGRISFDTVGSSFDTLLAVYNGTAVNALTAIASDNDSGGNLTSRVAFDAIGGHLYRIAIDGAAGTTGNLVLHWNGGSHLAIQRVSNTTFRLTLTGGPATYAIQGSSDLKNWTTLTTLDSNGSIQQYNDSTAGGVLWRFYRAALVR